MNGGAQVRPHDGVNHKELTLQLEHLYSQLPVKNPEVDRLVNKMYDCWLEGQESDKASALLHTQYHAVEKLNTALNIKW